MRVLHILPELESGGVEAYVCELTRALQVHGHSCCVVSNGGSQVPALEQDGVKHVTLPVHRKHPASLAQIMPLRRLLCEWQPDVVHANSRLPAWLLWLAWRSLPVKKRPHLVTTFHGFHSVNAYSAIMTRAEKIIAVSDCVRAHIEQAYQVPPERIRVIPHGIDAALYHPGFRPSAAWCAQWQRDFPHTWGKRWLTLPGRLTRIKGHHSLIDLIAQLDDPELHVLIVGGAHPRKQAYAAELRQLVTDRGLTQRVTFTGQRQDLREILSLSTLVFSLTTQPESFGKTILEAAALGRPVLAWDHGGAREILQALFPAGLVPLNDFPQLRERTLSLLASETIPAAATAFAAETSHSRTLALYQQLLTGVPS